jgi:uncharacterized metal-binding protein YceD (DUF177 family)
METPEFSHSVAGEEIPDKGMHLTLEASARQCAALSTRLEVQQISVLCARMKVFPLAGGPMLRVEGTVKADLEQFCVISGDPVAQSLRFDFCVDYAPLEMVEENLELSLADADPPEPLDDGKIDLGELVSQQLILNMDPYPRASTASLGDVIESLPKGRGDGVGYGAEASPFAALSALKTSLSAREFEE